jgi:drug/metabolite transporter (DMT)-like permease
MALFGSATPVSRLVGQELPAMLASGMRMLTAAALLVPILAIRRVSPEREVPKLTGRDVWLLAGIAAIGTFGFTLLLFYGMRLAPGTVGAAVMATTPAVTAIGAVWLLGDRLAAGKMTGLALAVAGVLVVNVTGASVAGGRNVWLGSALVFAAVCCEAAYTLLGKKLTANLSPLAIAVWASVGAGLLFAPFALIQLRTFDVAATQWRDWLTVVFWGAGTMGLGSVLWFSGLRRLTGVTASGFMAVMPVSALFLSYLLLGEAFSWWHLIGMGVVLAGLAFVVAADRKQQER